MSLIRKVNELPAALSRLIFVGLTVSDPLFLCFLLTIFTHLFLKSRALLGTLAYIVLQSTFRGRNLVIGELRFKLLVADRIIVVEELGNMRDFNVGGRTELAGEPTPPTVCKTA